MRKRGVAIRDVENRLGIRRSTLHYWFRDITLSDYHKQRLKKRADAALVKARVKAVVWHNAQKSKRMKLAYDSAVETLSKINNTDNSTLELALALLYLGEGMKKSGGTAMGNSDPLILRFFVSTLRRLYKIPVSEMRCELHLRADQNPKKITTYWSKTLDIPEKNFTRPTLDMRTVGRPTYLHYKGVCIVRCSRVAIQRKLMYIATAFCEQIAKKERG